MASADYETIANEVVRFYYTNFDNKETRKELLGAYGNDSMLTFGDESFLGANAIIEKLMNPFYDRIKHTITSIKSQPLKAQRGAFILVTGVLEIFTEEENPLEPERPPPMPFSQAFQILPDTGDNYYIYNDIFNFI